MDRNGQIQSEQSSVRSKAGRSTQMLPPTSIGTLTTVILSCDVVVSHMVGGVVCWFVFVSNCVCHFFSFSPVLKAKVALFAKLVKNSKNCVAYTGAGLSAASGLADYATKAKKTIAARPTVSAERGSGYHASPNFGHIALARLHSAGYLKCVINQNHDGECLGICCVLYNVC